MTSWQRRNFESKIAACKDPAVCDCVRRAEKDPILKKVCDVKFDTTSMNTEELAEHQKEKTRCYIDPDKPSLKLICECVTESNELKNDDISPRCKDIWDISNLTREERLDFVAEITSCLQHKDDPDFTLTLCECLRTADSDRELKERCINKFDLNTLSAERISELRETLDDCEFGGSEEDDVLAICECLKQQEDEGQLSPRCEDVMMNMEKKYGDQSPEEMKDFIRRLMDCLQR